MHKVLIQVPVLKKGTHYIHCDHWPESPPIPSPFSLSPPIILFFLRHFTSVFMTLYKKHKIIFYIYIKSRICRWKKTDSSLWVLLFSVNTVPSYWIHFSANDKVSFLFMARKLCCEKLKTVCAFRTSFIHSSAARHLGCCDGCCHKQWCGVVVWWEWPPEAHRFACLVPS